MVNVRSKKERITQTLLALSTLICSFQFPLKVQAQTSNIIDKYIFILIFVFPWERISYF